MCAAAAICGRRLPASWATGLVRLTIPPLRCSFSGAWLHALGGEPESRQVFSAIGVFDDEGVLAALATKVRCILGFTGVLARNSGHQPCFA